MTNREIIGGLMSLMIIGAILMIAHHFTARDLQESRERIRPEIVQQVEAYDLDQREERIAQKSRFQTSKKELHLRPFDPNTASEDMMLDMGMPPYLVSSLVKFRNHGGKFYKKEDIKKLYVFDPKWYALYEPYIQIDASKLGSITKYEKSKSYTTTSKSKKSASPLNLNSANADQLDAEWGVSPKTAENIIKFRDALGGFYDRSQVSEVYTLPDSVYQHNTNWFVEGGVKKININTADYETLNAHPYIRKNKWAKAIINYRKAHGNFVSVDDLQKIKSINPSELKKVTPYLSVH